MSTKKGKKFKLKAKRAFLESANQSDNPRLYMELLAAAEQAAACQMEDQEEAIIEELDELWKEMSAEERQQVDIMLGMSLHFNN